MAHAPQRMADDVARGFWAMPPGAARAEIVHAPWVGLRLTFPARTYRVPVQYQNGLQDIPLGPVAYDYRIPHGLPANRDGAEFAAIAVMHEMADAETWRPLRIGNVSGSGDICWGSGSDKHLDTPAQGWATFWASPFNDHLLENGVFPGGGLTPAAEERYRRRLEEMRRAHIAERATQPVAAHMLTVPVPPVAAPPDPRHCPRERWARFRAWYDAAPLKVRNRGIVQAARQNDAGYSAGSAVRNRLWIRLAKYAEHTASRFRCLRAGYSSDARAYASEAAYTLTLIRDAFTARACPARFRDYAEQAIAWADYSEFWLAQIPEETLNADHRKAEEGLTPTWPEFYAGRWREGPTCSPKPVGNVGAVAIPQSATHAVILCNGDLARRFPAYGWRQAEAFGRPCRHPDCADCARERVVFLGFAFRTEEGAFLTVLLHPSGGKPLRMVYTRMDGWRTWGDRAKLRKTAAQARRDRRHTLRMRVLRDPILRQTLTVTLTQPKPVHRQPMEAATV